MKKIKNSEEKFSFLFIEQIVIFDYFERFANFCIPPFFRCADGYMGQRCEFKDLDGTYLRK
jgi:hypothetical protein